MFTQFLPDQAGVEHAKPQTATLLRWTLHTRPKWILYQNRGLDQRGQPIRDVCVSEM